MEQRHLAETGRARTGVSAKALFHEGRSGTGAATSHDGIAWQERDFLAAMDGLGFRALARARSFTRTTILVAAMFLNLTALSCPVRSAARVSGRLDTA